jgi:UDP:flavonoid glycosyltransferase YjiC (YdhE family)
MPARIFLAPLDWGLGHATRCVPVIHALLKAGAEVELGASGHGIAFLQQEFPQLTLHPLPEYGITYTTNGMRGWHLLMQTPRVMRVMRSEYHLLDQLISKRNYTAVISDNRFGIRSDRIHSVCITHQLHLQTPPGFGMAAAFNRRMLGRFHEIWIPDLPGADNLSGALSHGGSALKVPQQFIGSLTRFQAAQRSETTAHILVLLSGPEPQRTLFERLLVPQLHASNRPCILVRGMPGQSEKPLTDKNITIFNHLATHALQQYLQSAYCVISRSGYSTLCDAAAAGVRFIAVPAPGQTEQEYLAASLAAKKRIVTQEQQVFDLPKALEEVAQITPLSVTNNVQWLEKAVQAVVSIPAENCSDSTTAAG